MMLDLGDHSSRSVPGAGLILEAAVPDQGSVAWTAAWPDEQIFDGPLQDVIGREADRVPHLASFQRLVEGREGKRRVGADDHGLPPGLGALNDGQEDLAPAVRTVHVAWPERGSETVAVLVEDEERVIADGLEVAVVRRLLLSAVHRTLGRSDGETHIVSA